MSVSCRKADKLLEIVSDDKTQLRKHKVAYGEYVLGFIATSHQCL